MPRPPMRGGEISDEVVALFRELESTPQSKRHGDDFKARERALMRALNLTAEWWTCCSVLDRRDGPTHDSPEYAEHGNWHTCRAVRNQLLAVLQARRQRA